MTIEDITPLEVAYHEAGHAVVGYLTGHIPVLATIVPDGESSGRVEFAYCVYLELVSVFHLPLEFADALEASVLTTLAGAAAENIYRISQGLGLVEDSDVFGAIFMLEEFGIDEDEDGRYFARAKIRAHEMLIQHWSSVERVATELMIYRTLAREDIISLIG